MEYKARLMESRLQPGVGAQASEHQAQRQKHRQVHQRPEGRESKRLKAKVDKHLSYGRIIAPKGRHQWYQGISREQLLQERNLPRSARKKILGARCREREDCAGWRASKPTSKTKLALEEPIDLRDFRFDLHRYSPRSTISWHHVIPRQPRVRRLSRRRRPFVAFYKESLEPLGICRLAGERVNGDDRCVIYGGTGFAAHNERYNATNLVCCDAMTG